MSKEKILTHEDLQASFTPLKLNDGSFYPYGFAWFLISVNGHKVYWHRGSWQGYQGCIFRFPDDKLTAIVFTNSNLSILVQGVLQTTYIGGNMSAYPHADRMCFIDEWFNPFWFD